MWPRKRVPAKPPTQADVSKYLLRYWEVHVRPEFEAEIEALNDEHDKTLIKGFMDRLESRLVTHVVMHEVPEKRPSPVDKKPAAVVRVS